MANPKKSRNSNKRRAGRTANKPSNPDPSGDSLSASDTGNGDSDPPGGENDIDAITRRDGGDVDNSSGPNSGSTVDAVAIPPAEPVRDAAAQSEAPNESEARSLALKSTRTAKESEDGIDQMATPPAHQQATGSHVRHHQVAAQVHGWQMYAMINKGHCKISRAAYLEAVDSASRAPYVPIKEALAPNLRNK